MAAINYPPAFLQGMQAQLGSGFTPFMQSLETAAPVSIRLNPFKPLTEPAAATPVPWCQNGRFLAERPSFTLHPPLHAGAYYVQEASSMFLEQVYNHINPGNQAVNVLDLCAAPGGKSTHLLSLINNSSLLVSNEVISSRNAILRENITKWGAPNIIVTQNRPAEFAALPGFFDIILVDAPCSGEGLFRKDKEAIAEWSEDNVAMCSLRQKEILGQVLPALKPGGYLIYSTCTYQPAENDENVEWLMQQGLQHALPATTVQGVTGTRYGYQFYPHKIRGEGFYISVLQKPGGEPEAPLRGNRQPASPAHLTALAQQYLARPEDFVLAEKKDLVFAYPLSVYYAMQYAASSLNARQAGILLGQFKGKNFIPAHQLALSIAVNAALPVVELTDAQALAYLRCETVTPAGGAQGWHLAKYKSYTLGWLKLLGNRANNYYPREWRILKQGSVTQL